MVASVSSSNRMQNRAHDGGVAPHSACIRWRRFLRVCCSSKLPVCCEECWSAVTTSPYLYCMLSYCKRASELAGIVGCYIYVCVYLLSITWLMDFWHLAAFLTLDGLPEVFTCQWFELDFMHNGCAQVNRALVFSFSFYF